MTAEQKDEMLDRCFAKICVWSLKELRGAFPDGIEVESPHNVYKWSSLNINNQGEVRLFYGTHASSNPGEVLFPDGSTYENSLGSMGERHIGRNFSDMEIKAKLSRCVRRRYGEIEWLINSWPSIKSMLMSRKKAYESLLEFEA